MRKPVRNRILSVILAVATVVSLLPMVSISAPKALEPETSDQSQTTTTPSNDLPWDHDTLYITLDGEDIDSLPLYSHEKVEIEASGLVENATYQWQVEHPEKDDVWVNVYDGTEKTISVTQALVENVLRADGTARLRCRAYTDSYAYLSNTVTVTVLAEENAAAHTTYAMNREGDVAVMAENSSEFVTVEIHYVKYEYVRHVDDKGKETYVLEEKGEAYGAYVATIRNGSDLSVEVPNPSIVGYEANLVPQDGAAQNNGVVAINLTDIAADVTFRVEYRPAEVPYSVHYYFQNIYDDQYVEDNTLAPAVTLFGYTGMHPDITYTQATFTGFTSLFYEPDIIAGDGSTVFNVYYERNYYLMEFDCNGGYGTDTIYVRYGTYVAVADPVRAGYVFGGWDLISTDNSDNTETLGDGQYNVLPQMLPAYNSAYKAIWDTAETTYTVVYWRENADDNGYSYWGTKVVDERSAEKVSGTQHNTLPTTEPFNSERNYFTYNAEKTIAEENARTDLVDGSIIVEGDGSTVVNVYYSRNVYSIVLIDDDVSSCRVEEHKHDNRCKVIACSYTHEHGADCIKTLVCTTPNHPTHTVECIICKEDEHTHGEGCLQCGKTVHTHTNECCIVDEHIHSIMCYNPESGYQVGISSESGTANAAIEAITNPQAGYVYKYRRYSGTYYNFFCDGVNWYYLGTDTQYRGLIDNNGLNNPGNNGGITSTPATKQTICGMIVHDHTSGCAYCTKPEGHVQDEDCCTMTTHAHRIGCYRPNNGYVLATNDHTGFRNVISNISNPQAGYIYRYQTSNNNNGRFNYFYDGANWYYLGRGTEYCGLINSMDNPGNYNYNFAPATKAISCSLDAHTHDGTSCTYCCLEEHIHEDVCYCDLTEHTHGNSCYKDVTHTHTDSCYEWSCGVDSHVHHDGCYAIGCGKPEHSHSDYSSSTDRKIIKIIQGKYGSYIGDEWTFEAGGKDYPSGNDVASWTPNTPNIYSQRLALIDIMPGNMTQGYILFEYEPKNQSKRYYNYYVECLPGETPDTTFEGVEYRHYLKDGTLTVDFAMYTAAEDFFSIAGFTKYALTYNGNKRNDINANISNLSNGAVLNFYYKRTQYNFKYFNHNSFLTSNPNNDTNIKYQTPLSGYEITKAYMEENHYPDKLEPNAYEFDGWYTTPEFFPGTEVDWNTLTMPDGPLTLYAKWVPVNRNVYFHLTYEDIATNTYWDTKDQHGNPVSYPIVVEHGAVLGTTYHYMPERNEDHDGDGVNDYIFVGWFYMDEDNKKRFAPDTMEIKRDLHLFAEWQSLIDTQYKVEYVLKDGATIKVDGVDTAYPAGTTLAVITEGHSTAGRTKTFTAKAGEQLLDAFKNAPVFPVTNTHSILMDADYTQNRYKFEYVVDDLVYYKVRYVDKVTGEVLGETGNIESHNAIITEKFKYFDDYVPEMFYIRKVLAYDGEATTAITDNIITFYYLPNTEENPEALYNVEYYRKNPVTGEYEQVQNEPGRDVIDGSVSVTIPKDKFTGYAYTLGEVITYDSNGNSTTGEYKDASAEKLTASLSRYGLVFRLYYDPVQYPYLIKFVEYGNPTHILGYGQIGDQNVYELDDVDEIKADYDKKLAYTAPDSISAENGKKYNFIDNSERTQTLTIRIDDLNEAKVNILTFYYEMEVIPIEYHAVCTVPGIVGGNVSQSSEPKPQNPQGCEAMVLPGFTFEGWFYDEACTQPVANRAWISGTKITPTVDGIVKGEDGKEHFYALFKPIVTVLTIEKTVNIGEDRDDSFLFHVQGVAGTITGGVDLIVAITGNGEVVIKELYCGEYTVTELTGWSWEYDISGTASKRITLVENATNNKVSFGNTYANPDWLGDECCKDNNFN